MSREALKTLFHPFASGTLVPPALGENFLFLGAEAGYAVPEGFEAILHPVQGFRPLYRALLAQQLEPRAVAEDRKYDGALVLIGKFRLENEMRVAEALSRVSFGGLIVVAGGKEDGIQPLKKRLMQLGIACGHLPKYHGVALWFQRPAGVDALVARLGKPAARIDNRFTAGPGQFSWDRIDEGSELLLARLPADFRGNVADFGAGWGYLSVSFAQRCPGIKGIDLFEADFQALESARANMAEHCEGVHARYFWQDLVGEEVKDKYDLIIMNPPFHEGHAADPAIGQAFIRRAAGALKIGGQVLLVANRGLPYEPVLAESLKASGEVCRNARFKVLWGKK